MGSAVGVGKGKGNSPVLTEVLMTLLESWTLTPGVAISCERLGFCGGTK